jgi:hypothetical protein
VAAVFGANASGKSNLVDALRWMQAAVQSSYRSWEPDSGIPRTRYRLDPDSARRPSEFMGDVLIDDVQFVYGFTVNSIAVEEEWLHTYPHGRERVVFERKGQRVELGSTVPERRGRAELLASLLRDNSLLLSAAVQANQAEVLPVYRWFTQRLRILDSRRDSAREPNVVAREVIQTVQRHPEFVDLLKAADLGISDLRIETPTLHEYERVQQLEARIAEAERGGPPDEMAKLVNELSILIKAVGPRRGLSFLHGPAQVALGVEEQSDGTLAWADLLISALSALDAGALMVTDEIDASLHPRLTARLVELFRNATTNPHGAQLLFTTHDATLLGTSLGDEVLKRDEVWFVEKEDGASRLYPLSDFHPRKNENRERRYLAGSYGAVPVVFEDSLVDSVLSARTERADGAA